MPNLDNSSNHLHSNSITRKVVLEPCLKLNFQLKPDCFARHRNHDNALSLIEKVWYYLISTLRPVYFNSTNNHEYMLYFSAWKLTGTSATANLIVPLSPGLLRISFASFGSSLSRPKHYDPEPLGMLGDSRTEYRYPSLNHSSSPY
jgi:hypothetical protein